jgi:uncharacterized protein (DUF433 family)
MAVKRAPYRERIIADPAIMVGKPVVKGTRIPVETVLGHLADNPDFDDLFAAYPRLTLEDVQACLAFAEDRVKRTPKAKPGALTTHPPTP